MTQNKPEGHTPRQTQPAGMRPTDARDRAIECYNSGRFQDAARFAQIALGATPANEGLLHILGASLVRIGSIEQGTQILRKLCQGGCLHPEAWCDLANGLRALEDIDGSLNALDKALSLRPHFPPAVRGKVTLLHAQGRAADAAPIIDAAMQAHPTDVSCVLAFATISRELGRSAEAIDLLLRHLRGGTVPAPLARAAHTQLAHLLDAERRYDEAFEHAMLSAQAGGPIPAQDDFAQTIAQWNKARYNATPSTEITDPLPVLVVGMPRSGTSLVEQILTSHPEIGTIGESPALPRIEQHLRQNAWPLDEARRTAGQYLEMMRSRSPGKARVVDKLPGNYTILGPITKLLPGATIIHCVRDARDTCLSCYFQNFGGGHSYARDLVALGRKHLAYQRLMKHWNTTLGISMLEVRYEELVADLERVSRLMLAHVGVPWDPCVLNFHTLKRHVRTASAGQVHKPLFTSSIGRWKNYESHLKPLFDTLGDSHAR
ncbi:MAG: sulfotransferase [Phycisphaeraceae bacterium]|nr:sulfotransferase [Phycisphaeraceae bacterium]MBX3367866.1 sulfotransferase [Phycisphaeraceae bacterium]